jgi:rhodanese-related sulfurtransferase
MNPAVAASDLVRLQPLSALGAESLERLPSICHRRSVAPGESLLGDTVEGKIAYGLQGQIKLESRPGQVEVIVGGRGRGLWPVWREGNMPVAAEAITSVDLLLMEGKAFDVMMVWDQLHGSGEAHGSGLALANHVISDPHQEDENWMQLSALVSEHSLRRGIFANVPVANLERLREKFERIEVKRGEVVIQQGAPGDYYYVIQRGRGRIVRTVGGTNVEIDEIGEGEGVGEEALLADTTRNANVIMKTDGVLRRLAKADFLSLLKEPLLMRIDPDEANRRVASGAVWLDVRFPAEFLQDGIQGAINIPLNQIRTAATVLDPSKEYVVYCQSGRRSATAAFLLSQHGIRAYLLDGGLAHVQSNVERKA